MKRAILLPHRIPPAPAVVANTLIESGVLKVVCAGWRRVGFNRKLANKLQSGLPSTPASNEGLTGTGASGIGVKRGGDDLKERPKKKHKSSGSAAKG